MSLKRVLVLAVASCLALSSVALAQGGRIEGRVVRADGTGVGGVTVVVNEAGLAGITDSNGSFRFAGVPAGTYSISFTLGDNADTMSGVEVAAGQTARVDQTVDWELSFADTITVVSASRRAERIVEAPAAVTLVTEAEIQREGSHGQLPKLLEFTPGVEPTQSGLFDYNLNTRGFNSSLNRRLVVLVDGRDPSVPFLAAQEWITVSQYMNDLSSAELVRGPSSALYGKNAFNGVLNLVTKAPGSNLGGQLRLSGGELSTRKAELRWAGDVGGGWFVKLNGSYLESGDFSVDRNVAPEYAGLVREAVPRVIGDNQASFYNLRFDKEMSNQSILTLEGGFAHGEQPALQTGIGRFSIPDVDRNWLRFNFTSGHWNFLAYFNDRDGDDQTALQSGGITFLDSQNSHYEVQTNWDFRGGKVRLVAGASHREEEIDSKNPAGAQTLVFAPVDSDSQAAYAQVDFDIGKKAKLVLAGRWDDSTLHEEQFSPKGALVVSLNPQNTLRFGYNEAFQVANYSELFLFTRVGVLPGALIDGLVCGRFGLSCGLAPAIPVIASGNASLEVEEVKSFEIGYTGVLGGKAFLTVDYYNSELNNFITDLLPQTGTALGQINPNYPTFTAPGIPAPILAALIGTVAGLTGGGQLTFGPDGSQIVTAVSYTNFGQVDTEGVDLGLTVRASNNWRFNANYSWFDFETQQALAGDPLVPNAPENKGGLGVAYTADKFDWSINGRFVEGFDWSVGTLFRGRVPSYETVDLNANYHISDSVSVGLNVSNLFDDEHFEAFGGDLLGRRAIGNITFNW